MVADCYISKEAETKIRLILAISSDFSHNMRRFLETAEMPFLSSAHHLNDRIEEELENLDNMSGIWQNLLIKKD